MPSGEGARSRLFGAAAWLNAPVTEWATKITPGVQSALVKDPGINYILPIYDSMSGFVVPGVRIAGKSNSVKLATFNGTPFVIDMIQQGQVHILRAEVEHRGVEGLKHPQAALGVAQHPPQGLHPHLLAAGQQRRWPGIAGDALGHGISRG